MPISARPSKDSREQSRQTSLLSWSLYSNQKTEKHDKKVKYSVSNDTLEKNKVVERDQDSRDIGRNRHAKTDKNTTDISRWRENNKGERLGHKEKEG